MIPVQKDVQLSPHFRLSEFRCKCGDITPGNLKGVRLPGCKGNPMPSPALVQGLEALRQVGYAGTGLAVVSGYRCVEYNRKVGGAKDSRHVKADAADVRGRVSLKVVEAMNLFNGIGWDRSTGFVTHVDVRPVRVTPWMYDR